jgi:hypothetical protein
VTREGVSSERRKVVSRRAGLCRPPLPSPGDGWVAGPAMTLACLCRRPHARDDVPAAFARVSAERAHTSRVDLPVLQGASGKKTGLALELCLPRLHRLARWTHVDGLRGFGQCSGRKASAAILPPFASSRAFLARPRPARGTAHPPMVCNVGSSCATRPRSRRIGMAKKSKKHGTPSPGSLGTDTRTPMVSVKVKKQKKKSRGK